MFSFDPVRKLKPPFLKVEDVSYSYRPLVYETRQWPHPDVNCSPKGCPFELTKQGENCAQDLHDEHTCMKVNLLSFHASVFFPGILAPILG